MDSYQYEIPDNYGGAPAIRKEIYLIVNPSPGGSYRSPVVAFRDVEHAEEAVLTFYHGCNIEAIDLL